MLAVNNILGEIRSVLKLNFILVFLIGTLIIRGFRSAYNAYYGEDNCFEPGFYCAAYQLYSIRNSWNYMGQTCRSFGSTANHRDDCLLLLDSAVFLAVKKYKLIGGRFYWLCEIVRRTANNLWQCTHCRRSAVFSWLCVFVRETECNGIAVEWRVATSIFFKRNLRSTSLLESDSCFLTS